MAVEPRRKCGYRKEGGMYLVGAGVEVPCKKLPFSLKTCPTCGAGFKLARGWTWIDPKALIGGHCAVNDAYAWCFTGDPMDEASIKWNCPMDERKAGLLWVGSRFYTPTTFIEEAMTLGISKRIPNIPRGLELGKTWVLVAHKHAGTKHECKHLDKSGRCTAENAPHAEKECLGEHQCGNVGGPVELVPKPCAGIFYAFRPTQIELLLDQSKVDALTDEERERFERRGIKILPVPDDDPDHHGSVWDENGAEEAPQSPQEGQTDGAPDDDA